MADELIAVTGAGGGVGGRVARRLAAAGANLRLLTRDPDSAPALPSPGTSRIGIVRADFHEPGPVRQALTGVQTLFLVSATEHADRVRLHTNAVDAARAAGVSRIVYLSFLAAAPDATFTFARDHWHTEQHIRRTGLAYTFLRDSLYQDALPYFPDSEGVLRGPAGDGRFAPVARNDVADVAAAVLLAGAGAGAPAGAGAARAGAGALSGAGHGAHDGRTYDVTGPAAISMAEVAEQLTQAAGRPIRYHAETMPEAYASRAHFGAPEWAVAGWVTSYAAIATGELDLASRTVAEVAGHPPISVAEFLAANPDLLARLRRAR